MDGTRQKSWGLAPLLGLACLVTACSAAAGSGARLGMGPARDETPFEVRLWQAGRPIAPGLSAARMAELEAERGEALALLESMDRLEGARLRAWLEREETPDELWCAAARVAAALERYDLASLVARALAPTTSASRVVVARATLHELYGRWFQGADEVEPFLAGIAGGAGTRLLLESIRREERRSRERLFAGLEQRPTQALGWLEDPDPEVRSGAARILAETVRLEEASPGDVLEVLIAHLDGEHEPQAFHEALQACLAPLERIGVDEPASLRLRALLVDIARTEGEPRTRSAAQALAHLPWREGGARDLGHVLTGVEALGAMLRGLAAADRSRGVNDPDPAVAVLSAMRELCTRANAFGLGADLRASSARTSLFTVLGDPLQDEAVRSAAAAAIGSLARASDGPQLAAILADPAVGVHVKHALLGTLTTILVSGAAASGAEEVLHAVALQTGADDADLRRRALLLLAEPRLDVQVRALDPSFLVARLEREDGREATQELLRLLQRFGREDMLADVLALARFDVLGGDPELLDELASALRQMAGSGRGALDAAFRLASVRSEGTDLARLRHALEFASRVDEASLRNLGPEEHLAILSWVGRSLKAGVAPRDLAPTGLAFEQRLLDVHLAAAESASQANLAVDDFEGAHLAALMRADLFLSGAGRGSKPQVEDAFERALQRASALEHRSLVLRDRARFRAAANEGVKAMSDYRRLLESGADADSLIGIPDLRSAVELLGRLDEAGGASRSATAAEACELLRRLIARPAWRAEPASVRMQDVRDWIQSALEAGDLECLRQVALALEDLPLTQLEAKHETDPAPLWLGLTREAGWFQELLDLRVRARLEIRALESQG